MMETLKTVLPMVSYSCPIPWPPNSAGIKDIIKQSWKKKHWALTIHGKLLAVFTIMTFFFYS